MTPKLRFDLHLVARTLFFVWVSCVIWKLPLKAAEEAEKGKGAETTQGYTGIYVTVPDILSNLHGDDTRNHFLKLCLTFEAKTNEDAKHINEVMPIIIDQFLIYLRELRIDDLKGAEGLFLLKQQLMDRANVILNPVVVSRVLFREILVQ